MTIAWTPTAEAQLDNQIAYSRAHFGANVASKTLVRIERFLADTLDRYPRAGIALGQRGLFECAIPRTPFVVIFRVEPPATVRILGFFHGAQNRADFDPDQM